MQLFINLDMHALLFNNKLTIILNLSSSVKESNITNLL